MTKVYMKPTLDKFESGELQPVDLTFVPEVVEPILPDEEKLTKLTEDLKLAKEEVNKARTSGTDEDIQVARAYAKSLKIQLKELKRNRRKIEANC